MLVVKCPDCNGMLIRNSFEIVCKRCGLVIKEPICIRGAVVFGH